MATNTATVSEIIEAVSILNDGGRWIALQQCLALANVEMYQNKETMNNKIQKEKILTAAEKNEKDREEFIRQYHKKHIEGDLQLDGYILLGWYQGRKGEACNSNWTKSKYGLIGERGMAAYLPKSGMRRVYIFNTHARYAPHPDPKWGNKRWTYFAETDNKPCNNENGCGNNGNRQSVITRQKSIKKMHDLFSQTKPDLYKETYPQNAWILSVPIWLLDEKKDMRPLYLAGGKPE